MDYRSRLVLVFRWPVADWTSPYTLFSFRKIAVWQARRMAKSNWPKLTNLARVSEALEAVDTAKQRKT